jgi:uncharacterized protein (TIGR00375 family)
MDLATIAYFAKVKGLGLVGTGDITHPAWRREVGENLQYSPETGLYRLKRRPEFPVMFIPSCEVATVFEYEGRVRRVHHCLLIPDLEVAEQLADLYSKWANLAVDGRPTFNVTAEELLEVTLSVSPWIEVFPAHAWTPWWSVFGAKGGFDRLEECYGGLVGKIHALETGLSSDPPMNWRVSWLDAYQLVSNSDCHSPHPHRLGREATIFEVKEPTYRTLVEAVRTGKGLWGTIETWPEYGKYHWSGHRACGVSLPPEEALKKGNRCPRCGKPLTKGVEQRVEELADRPRGFSRPNAVHVIYLLPLHEVIAKVLGATSPTAKRVEELYNRLVQAFGNEYQVMLDAPLELVAKIAGGEVAAAIGAVRQGRVKVVPGYDGVYGEVVLPAEGEQPTGGSLDHYI